MPVLYVSTDLSIYDNGDVDDGKVIWLAMPVMEKATPGDKIRALKPFFKLGPKYMQWILDMVKKLEERVNAKLADQSQLERVVARVKAIIEHQKGG